MSKNLPWIKWVGSKRQMLKQYASLLPEEFNNYIEPFAGSGAVYFWLREQGRIRGDAVLGDSNPELMATYRAVKDDVEAVIEQLSAMDKRYNGSTPLRVVEERDDGTRWDVTLTPHRYYYSVRELDRRDGWRETTDIIRAARFLFLNRTSYNGLWRTNRKGQMNAPCGKYKNPRICRPDDLRRTSELLADAVLVHAPFDSIEPVVSAGDFVYFDPPYLPTSKSADFTTYTKDGFTVTDQVRLRDLCLLLSAKGVKVAVSNSKTDEVDDLYSNFHRYRTYGRRNVNSVGSKRGKVSEYLITNY